MEEATDSEGVLSGSCPKTESRIWTTESRRSSAPPDEKHICLNAQGDGLGQFGAHRYPLNGEGDVAPGSERFWAERAFRSHQRSHGSALPARLDRS